MSPPLTATLAASAPVAFGDSVRPHLSSMNRAASRVLGCSAEADDAVQDTLLRIWSSGWLPEEPRSALCHLVRKTSLQRLRADRRRCHHETCARIDANECLHVDDPADIVARREQAVLVREAIARLGEPFRRILELHVFAGLDYAELAEELELAPGTVRSRLHRARAALKRSLEGGACS